MNQEQANLEIVMGLLGRQPDNSSASGSREADGKALLDAATRTNLARVRELLARGVDANSADP